MVVIIERYQLESLRAHRKPLYNKLHSEDRANSSSLLMVHHKEFTMKISARNIFTGTISALVNGAVNAEVELTLAGGDKLVAIVTESSVKSLELAVGKTATALIKAPWVMVLAGESTLKFSARNQLAGTVKSLTKGAVNTEVAIELPGGNLVYSVITNEAVLDLGLKEGVPASALIKASHVILGVPV